MPRHYMLQIESEPEIPAPVQVQSATTRETCPHHGNGFTRIRYAGVGSLIVGACPAGNDNCRCRQDAAKEGAQ